MELKDKLNQAFALLRKQGYIAKQNYKCCSSCAGYAIACEAEQRHTECKPVEGAVYYHRQDAADAWPSKSKWWRKHDGPRKLMIRFGSLDTERYGELGKQTVDVGKDVCAVFFQLGIVHEWDGNGDRCIEVPVNQ